MQGTVFGPLLFLVYINDITDYVLSSCRLFADDCILYRQINSPTDAAILQNDLKELENWEVWKRKFNIEQVDSSLSKNQALISSTYFNYHINTRYGYSKGLKKERKSRKLGLMHSNALFNLVP